METVRCNLCGGDDTDLIMEREDKLYGKGSKFYLRKCRRCGLVYLNPRPTVEEMPQYYPDDYIAYPVAIEDEPSVFRRFDRKYGLFKRCHAVTSFFEHSGTMLDIGCATGVFINGMRDRGWQVYGVDTSLRATRYARERFGLDVFTGELQDAGFESDFFDLVTMWDVLEHVHNPKQTLIEINRVLKPGGVLALSLPNIDSVEAKLFGPSWIGWDVPRHLYMFPLHVLRRMLFLTGFHMEKVSFFTGRYYVFALSAALWLKDVLDSKQAVSFAMKILYSWPLRLGALPAYWLLDLLGKSSIMTVFSRSITYER